MVLLSKLVVASQAYLLNSSYATFLAPQSLNEQGRTENSSEVQKIQMIEKSLRQVVQKLNGFSKQLNEQTTSLLSRDQAEVAADVANMLEDNPRQDLPTDGNWDKPLDMDNLKEQTAWFNYKDFLANAEVSTTHIAIHALTALVTTYLDNLVPSADQAMSKNYWSIVSKRDSTQWKNFFLQPLNNEVVGYMVPSFAKLVYHLTMGMAPKEDDKNGLKGHYNRRATWSKEYFQTPEMYPLADTWTADNVEVVKERQNDGVSYKTKHIVMSPTTTAEAQTWQEPLQNAIDYAKKVDDADTRRKQGTAYPPKKGQSGAYRSVRPSEEYKQGQTTPVIPDYKYSDIKSNGK